VSVAVRFTIPADHPAFAGHFPGAPLLPGALLLDEILLRLPLAPAASGRPLLLSGVKFRRPVLPDTGLSLRYEAREAGGLSFQVSDDHGVVADGIARSE
jgi:3-hydroxyacyl-[acyl-carrier-protein] dehydratase